MIAAAIIASAALLVTSANAAGQAVVINKCSYPVHLYNTPAAGGGQSESDSVLQTGGSWSQQWTELTNGNGWSIKLSQSTNMANIMQYEYTYHNDGIIWYDLSDVNGNPWDGNWEITASGSCSPKQQAYRYATDDAYGMQSCPDSSTITVTLCSGTNGGTATKKGKKGSGKVIGASVPAAVNTPWAVTTSAAPTSAAPTYTEAADSTTEAPAATTAPASSPAQQPAYSGFIWSLYGDKVAAGAGPATTLATQVRVEDKGAVTVTNVQTAVVTQYVTATAAPAKRHVHHRHAHYARGA